MCVCGRAIERKKKVCFSHPLWMRAMNRVIVTCESWPPLTPLSQLSSLPICHYNSNHQQHPSTNECIPTHTMDMTRSFVRLIRNSYFQTNCWSKLCNHKNGGHWPCRMLCVCAVCCFFTFTFVHPCLLRLNHDVDCEWSSKIVITIGTGTKQGYESC